jgi:hypothetical protein
MLPSSTRPQQRASHCSCLCWEPMQREVHCLLEVEVRFTCCCPVWAVRWPPVDQRTGHTGQQHVNSTSTSSTSTSWPMSPSCTCRRQGPPSAAACAWSP